MSGFSTFDLGWTIDGHSITSTVDTVTSVVNYWKAYGPGYNAFAGVISDINTVLLAITPGSYGFYTGTMTIYSDPVAGIPGANVTLFRTDLLSNDDYTNLTWKLFREVYDWMGPALLDPWAAGL